MNWTMINNDSIVTENNLEPLDNTVVMDFCVPITKCSKNMQKQINNAIADSKNDNNPDRWSKTGPEGIVVDYLALGIELDNVSGLKYYVGILFHDVANKALIADARIDISIADKEFIQNFVHKRIDQLLFK